jgi:small-conductance mechanosensitive channel
MVVEWRRVLAEPLFIRAILVLLGLLAIFLAVRQIQRSVTRRVEAPQARYRIRKMIALGGYFFIILFISLVFSDQLGHLAVAFGVVGAGVAFALQEVIASLGSWVAIIMGRYYQVGDRIMINGILGDVIDINALRTTVMECGDWVGTDLFQRSHRAHRQ